jgi:hypothetical protein
MAIKTTFTLDHVRKPKRRMNRPEQDLQIQLVRQLPTLLAPGTVFLHVPNGGARTKAESGILKAMGVMAGFPDLLFIREGRAQLGLELKAQKEGLSDAQREAFPILRAAGVRIEVARSIDESIEHLREAGIPLRIKQEDWEYGRRKHAA